MRKDADPHGTSEQLRHHIDRGRSGSKVPWPDPAAAPLGADEEAAGTPPHGEAVDMALERESNSSASHERRPGSQVLVRTLMTLSTLAVAVVALLLLFGFA